MVGVIVVLGMAVLLGLFGAFGVAICVKVIDEIIERNSKNHKI